MYHGFLEPIFNGRTDRMIKKLIEKIFRRKELAKYKSSAEILEKEVEEKAEEIGILTSGESIRLTQHEKRMVLLAIEEKPFRVQIELPITKAHIRVIYRELREKIKLHLKEDPVVDEIREAPEKEPEVKEDEETKEAKIE